VALVAITTVTFLLGSTPVLALDPSPDVSQYAHTAWTVRDGFSLGNIYAMAQNARRLSLTWDGIRLVSLRRHSEYSVATTCRNRSHAHHENEGV